MPFLLQQAPPSIAAVANPVIIRVQADPGFAVLGNYRMLVFLQKETGYRNGVFEEHEAMETWPDENGNFEVNFRRPLESLVKSQPPATPRIAAPFLARDMNTRWRATLEERHDGVVGLGTQINIDPSIVVKAAFKASRGQGLASHQAQGLFLTHQPRTKRGFVDTPEFLSWIGRDGMNGYQVRVTVHKDNGNTQTLIRGIYPCNPGDIVTIPVGYEAWGLDAYPDMVAWVVKVHPYGPNWNGQEGSEPMRYELDTARTWMDQPLVFENSLGGWDTIMMQGNRRESINAVDQKFQAYAGHGEIRQQSVNGRAWEDIELNTGALTTEENLWARELLLPGRVFEIIDDNWREVDVERARTPVKDNLDDVRGFSVKYRDVYENAGLY